MSDESRPEESSEPEEPTPAGTGGAAAPNTEPAGPGEPGRLDLFRYATADNSTEYVAIMRLFTETLLTDLSASEVSALLSERGVRLSVDDVDMRCRQLERWGNLVRSVRDARMPTVADYLRSRSRFQASKLGGRVHRHVDEILRATTGVRDVARELLGGMVETLDRILGRLEQPDDEIDADALAADVTTVFANQQLFTDSVRDFYAYLHQVLSRYDLVGAEYARFKDLLLTYVDLITADVARHAPAVVERLEKISPRQDGLLAVLATLPTLTNADGTPAERQAGRVASDWDEFTAWYGGHSGRSGPAQLRNAANQALGQLLTNAKRMLAAAGTGVSRRADLLRLSRWFTDVDAGDAHRLFAAAFGAYPSRHLLLGPDEEAPAVGALTSWWDADPVEVPLSLRERGDRTARGRTARVPDPGLDEQEMLAEAEAEQERNRAAAADLVAAGNLDGARLTPTARDLLLDRLGELLAVGQDDSEPLEWHDSDLAFVLRARSAAGARTTVHGDDGLLVVDDLSLTVEPLTDAGSDAATDQAATGTGS